MLDGDPASEVFLSEIVNAQAFPMRHMSMESLYEYGSRAGVWRVLRAFERRQLPLTIFAVARGHSAQSGGRRGAQGVGSRDRLPRAALAQLPAHRRGDRTRAHGAKPSRCCARRLASAPLGWYTGRDSPNTRRLVVEHGGLLYDSDSYADDLPYWTDVEVGTEAQPRRVPHLVVPYTLDTNDMRFATAQGFNSGDTVLRLSEGGIRHALPGRRPERPECAEDAVGRTSLPHRRATRRVSKRSSGFSTTFSNIRRSGSAAASTSRSIGSRRIRYTRPAKVSMDNQVPTPIC